MFSVLTIVIVTGSLVLTAWALVMTVRNRPADLAILIATGVLELLLLVQLAVSIVAFASGNPTDGVLFFGYLITALVMVLLAGFWAFAELSRWGPAVLAAAALTVVVMLERMDQIWV